MSSPPRRPRDDRAAALLAEMAAVRGGVEANAARVARAAERSKDWTVYVKAAPLACAAGAAAAGFLLVPAKRSKPRAVPARGKADRTAAPAPVARPVSGRGPWMGALSVLGNVAVRAGTAYLSQQAGKAFGTAAADAGQPSPEPARQPTGPR